MLRCLDYLIISHAMFTTDSLAGLAIVSLLGNIFLANIRTGKVHAILSVQFTCYEVCRSSFSFCLQSWQWRLSHTVKSVGEHFNFLVYMCM